MTKVADIHEALAAEGYPVESVRRRADHVLAVCPRGTPAEEAARCQSRAEELAAQWEPEPEPEEPTSAVMLAALDGDVTARASVSTWRTKKAARSLRIRKRSR
mgnify:CR=1 FL=1